VYGAHTEITSDDHPVPDYHFATGQVKWLNKNVMVARPAVLYVRDVPIVWLPFIFQDVRKGRRSGILIPRFGLNDIVRPTRGYQRHVANVGYYFVVNDYVDFLVATDWYAARYLSLRSEVRYRWLDRFIQGDVAVTRLDQLDQSAHSLRFGWQHRQSFNSRTTFTTNIDYATSANVIQTNTVNPALATASLTSQASFNKRFDWGTLDIGGSRSQELSTQQVTQNFPRVNLTPSAVNLSETVTWSPGFSYNNQQTFHVAQAPLLVAGPLGFPDTLPQFADDRATDVSFQTPLRIGRWNWANSFTISDRTSNARQEYVLPDSSHLVFDRTFSTTIDWETGINLPSIFPGTWKLQPGIAIINQTSAGPFMLRNQFTGGQFLRQGKRLQFNASTSPTFFGFFPGLGPIARIRHSITPLVSYAYAPGSAVSPAFARALDPTGRNFRTQSDPQQTISLGLAQNIEAKLKPPPGDTTGHEAKKIRLLGITTSTLSYNFEQAKHRDSTGRSDRTGWQTQTLNNSFASDLLPGFSLSVTHDLWDGLVGLRSSKFSPFLTNVAATFAITPATLRGIGSLFGLGHHGAPPPAPGGAAAPGAPAPDTGAGGALLFGRKTFAGPGALPYGPGGAGGAGGGFQLALAYNSARTRPNADTVSTGVPFIAGAGGRSTLTLNLAFSPTAHWALTWGSQYDFDTQQFGDHTIRLERDLHRWHASFSFLKSANGNFAFSFYVSLLDESDIKFNYEQQTFVQ
jgi:hypothetical protein